MKSNSYIIILIVVSIIGSSCVKKNLKAIEDDSKTYDPDISLNKIFFAKTTDGNTDIFEINTDGSSSKNITNSTDKDEFYPAISHDAKRIAYASGDRLFQSAIDGSNEVEITNNSIFSTRDFTPTYLSWSNKSNFITFQNAKENVYHYIDSQYDTKINKSIAKNFSNSTKYISTFITFSPIKDKVIFVNKYETDPMTGTVVNWSSLELADLSGENDSTGVILSPEGVITTLQFFKNGEQLLYQYGNSIYMIDVDGENNTKLVSQDSFELISGFSASPDGSQIVYSSNISGNYELYVFDLETKEATKITNTTEDELHPFWN